ncbi:MAG: tRNA pseudouridine(55) synthase TruB [Lachnospiraceae bacterium]|nr:tRNA pseudouridine(55) synthase TruB [Lachnospiraceae bacterium]MBR3277885.1 tRNA pseudouridine(55) synthase TruB [Lachnospiraceae bacterium]
MVHGVINVRKEKGMTSFSVVARCRRIFGQKKIGHTGTLDPDAEGVLVVCLGKGTKLVDMLSHGTKTYEAVLRLGCVTDTQDTSGTVLREFEVNVSPDEAEACVVSFEGPQMQVPPMYSALKVDGKKLVDLARRGIEVERKAREVIFSDIEILETDLPRVRFRVTCSKGAYIRTLCEDIGMKLGCGGCMESLLRTRTGRFEISEALTLDEISEKVSEGDLSFVMPIDKFFDEYPKVQVPENLDADIRNGNRFELRGLSDIPNKKVRVYLSDGAFAGIYKKSGKRFSLEKHFYIFDTEEGTAQ